MANDLIEAQRIFDSEMEMMRKGIRDSKQLQEEFKEMAKVKAVFKIDWSSLEEGSALLESATLSMHQFLNATQEFKNPKKVAQYFTTQETALKHLAKAWNGLVEEAEFQGLDNINNLASGSNQNATNLLQMANVFEALGGSLISLEEKAPGIKTFVDQMRQLKGLNNILSVQNLTEGFKELKTIASMLKKGGVDIAPLFEYMESEYNKGFQVLGANIKKTFSDVMNDALSLDNRTDFGVSLQEIERFLTNLNSGRRVRNSGYHEFTAQIETQNSYEQLHDDFLESDYNFFGEYLQDATKALDEIQQSILLQAQDTYNNLIKTTGSQREVLQEEYQGMLKDLQYIDQVRQKLLVENTRRIDSGFNAEARNEELERGNQQLQDLTHQQEAQIAQMKRNTENLNAQAHAQKTILATIKEAWMSTGADMVAQEAKLNEALSNTNITAPLSSEVLAERAGISNKNSTRQVSQAIAQQEALQKESVKKIQELYKNRMVFSDSDFNDQILAQVKQYQEASFVKAELSKTLSDLRQKNLETAIKERDAARVTAGNFADDIKNIKENVDFVKNQLSQGIKITGEVAEAATPGVESFGQALTKALETLTDDKIENVGKLVQQFQGLHTNVESGLGIDAKQLDGFIEQLDGMLTQLGSIQETFQKIGQLNLTLNARLGGGISASGHQAQVSDQYGSLLHKIEAARNQVDTYLKEVTGAQSGLDAIQELLKRPDNGIVDGPEQIKAKLKQISGVSDISSNFARVQQALEYLHTVQTLIQNINSTETLDLQSKLSGLNLNFDDSLEAIRRFQSGEDQLAAATEQLNDLFGRFGNSAKEAINESLGGVELIVRSTFDEIQKYVAGQTNTLQPLINQFEELNNNLKPIAEQFNKVFAESSSESAMSNIAQQQKQLIATMQDNFQSENTLVAQEVGNESGQLIELANAVRQVIPAIDEKNKEFVVEEQVVAEVVEREIQYLNDLISQINNTKDAVMELTTMFASITRVNQFANLVHDISAVFAAMKDLRTKIGEIKTNPEFTVANEIHLAISETDYLAIKDIFQQLQLYEFLPKNITVNVSPEHYDKAIKQLDALRERTNTTENKTVDIKLSNLEDATAEIFERIRTACDNINPAHITTIIDGLNQLVHSEDASNSVAQGIIAIGDALKDVNTQLNSAVEQLGNFKKYFSAISPEVLDKATKIANNPSPSSQKPTITEKASTNKQASTNNQINDEEKEPISITDAADTLAPIIKTITGQALEEGLNKALGNVRSTVEEAVKNGTLSHLRYDGGADNTVRQLHAVFNEGIKNGAIQTRHLNVNYSDEDPFGTVELDQDYGTAAKNYVTVMKKLWSEYYTWLTEAATTNSTEVANIYNGEAQNIKKVIDGLTQDKEQYKLSQDQKDDLEKSIRSAETSHKGKVAKYKNKQQEADDKKTQQENAKRESDEKAASIIRETENLKKKLQIEKELLTVTDEEVRHSKEAEIKKLDSVEKDYREKHNIQLSATESERLNSLRIKNQEEYNKAKHALEVKAEKASNAEIQQLSQDSVNREIEYRQKQYEYLQRAVNTDTGRETNEIANNFREAAKSAIDVVDKEIARRKTEDIQLSKAQNDQLNKARQDITTQAINEQISLIKQKNDLEVNNVKATAAQQEANNVEINALGKKIQLQQQLVDSLGQETVTESANADLIEANAVATERLVRAQEAAFRKQTALNSVKNAKDPVEESVNQEIAAIKKIQQVEEKLANSNISKIRRAGLEAEKAGYEELLQTIQGTREAEGLILNSAQQDKINIQNKILNNRREALAKLQQSEQDETNTGGASQIAQDITEAIKVCEKAEKIIPRFYDAVNKAGKQQTNVQQQSYTDILSTITEALSLSNELVAKSDELANSQQKVKNALVEGVQSNLSRWIKNGETYASMSNNVASNKQSEYSSTLAKYQDTLSSIQTLVDSKEFPSQESLSRLQEYVQQLSQAESILSSNKMLPANDKAIQTQYRRISDMMVKYSAMTQEQKQVLLGFQNELSRGVSADRLSSITAGIEQLRAKLVDTGRAGQSLGDRLKHAFAGITQYVSTVASIYQIIGAIKKGIQTIIELDTALTEMSKVSDESIKALKEFQTESYSLASAVGSTGGTLQNSAADWMRLGESLEQAKESAQDTAILLNVSEFESVDEATNSLVAMSQAYNELTKIDIIDKLNEVGNNYSISTDEIASALQRSASALKTAGNDMDEAVALITAGNAIVQNADSVGSGIRTIALRIQGTEAAKEELAKLGEDTEDFVVQTNAKIQQVVKDFTAVASNNYKGIDILDENGNFKSTYEILQSIADIYSEIQETDKKFGTNHLQGLLETLAGKNRANIAASILQNGDMLRSVYESSQGAYGSAQEELDKYLDSVAAHIEQVKNKWEELWAGAMSREFLNFWIDLGGVILSVANTIGIIPTAMSAGLLGGGLVEFFQLLRGQENVFGNIKKHVLEIMSLGKMSKDVSLVDNIIGNYTDANKNPLTGQALIEAVETDKLSKAKKQLILERIKNTEAEQAEAIASGEVAGAETIETETIVAETGALVTDTEVKIADNAATSSFAIAQEGLAKTLGITVAELQLLTGALMAVGIAFVGLYAYSKAYHAFWSNAMEDIIARNKDLIESHDKIFNVTREAANGYKANAESLKELSEQLAETEYGTKEYYQIAQRIADQFPDMITGYNAEGEAIIATNTALTEQIEEYEKLYSIKKKVLIGQIKQNNTSEQTSYNQLVATVQQQKNKMQETQHLLDQGYRYYNTSGVDTGDAMVDSANSVDLQEQFTVLSEQYLNGLDQIKEWQVRFKTYYTEITNLPENISQTQSNNVSRLQEVAAKAGLSLTEYENVLRRFAQNDYSGELANSINALFDIDLNQTSIEEYNRTISQVLNSLGQLMGLDTTQLNQVKILFNVEDIQKQAKETRTEILKTFTNEFEGYGQSNFSQQIFNLPIYDLLDWNADDARLTAYENNLNRIVTSIKSDEKQYVNDLLKARQEQEKILTEAEQYGIHRYFDKSRSQVMPPQTKFGNIDTNKRQLIHWNKINIEQNKTALTSYGMYGNVYPGDISTVIGSADTYKGIDIAYSPILQGEKGPELLAKDFVDRYINSLVTAATRADGTIDISRIIKIDATGLEIDGKHVQELIADVGNTAIETSEKMHFMGPNGALALAQREILAINQDLKDTGYELYDAYDAIQGIDEITLNNLFDEDTWIDNKEGIISALNTICKSFQEYNLISQGSNNTIEETIALLEKLGYVTKNTPDNFTALKTAAKDAISGITNANEAYVTAEKEQNSNGHVTQETYDKLIAVNKEYSKAIEHTVTGLKLDVRESKKLNKAEKDLAKEKIIEARQELVDKYKLNEKQIAKLRRGYDDLGESEQNSRMKAISAYYASNEAIQSNIRSLIELQDQFNAATSAYQTWQDAQEGGEYGDKYDSVQGWQENFQKLYKNGLIGREDYQAYLEYITGIDQSEIHGKELDKQYKQVDKLISRYYTEDAKGSQNLYKDIQAATKAAGVYDDFFDKDGSMNVRNYDELNGYLNEYLQKTYGQYATLSLESMIDQFARFKDMGWMEDTDSLETYSQSIDDVTQSISDMKKYQKKYTQGKDPEWQLWEDRINKANEYKDNLEILGSSLTTNKELQSKAASVSERMGKPIETPVNFVTALSAQEYIEKLQELKIGLNDEEAITEINDMINYVNTLRLQLEDPMILHIDTAQVEKEYGKDAGTFVENLAEFEKIYQEELISLVNAGGDTSKTEEKLTRLYDEITQIIEQHPELKDMFGDMNWDEINTIQDLAGQLQWISSTDLFAGTDAEELANKLDSAVANSKFLQQAYKFFGGDFEKDFNQNQKKPSVENIKQDTVEVEQPTEITPEPVTISSIGQKIIDSFLGKHLQKEKPVEVEQEGEVTPKLTLSDIGQKIIDSFLGKNIGTTEVSNTVNTTQNVEYTTETNAPQTVSEISQIGPTVDEASQHSIGDLGTINAGSLVDTLTAKFLTLGSVIDVATRPRTVTVDYKQNGNINGAGSWQGTAAFASGTAFASGNIGAKETSTSLVGELGPEMRVRGSRWELIGQNGAEFTDVRKGDIIFNAQQTDQLLNNGHIRSRGKQAYAQGTAGNAYWNTNLGAVTSRTSASNKGKVAKSGKKSKKTGEIYDWIEVYFDRLQRAIDAYTRVAESTYSTFAERVKNYDGLLETIKLKQTQEYAAADAYLKQANTIAADNKYSKKNKNGLTDEMIKLIQEGAIQLDNYNDKQKAAIDEYKTYYDKYLASITAAQEAEIEYEEAATSRTETQIQELELLIQKRDHETTLLQNNLDLMEKMNQVGDERNRIDSRMNDYSTMANNSLNNVKTVLQEIALLKERNKTLDAGSEAYKANENSIAEYRETIQSTISTIYDYADAWANAASAMNDAQVEMRDKQNDLLSAQGNRNSLGVIAGNNNVFAQQIKNIQDNLLGYTNVYNQAVANVNTAKNSFGNIGNNTLAKEAYGYVNKGQSVPSSLIAKIETALADDKIPASEKTVLANVLQAALQWNAALNAKEEAEYTRDMYIETSKQDIAGILSDQAGAIERYYHNVGQAGNQAITAAQNSMSLAEANGRYASEQDYQTQITETNNELDRKRKQRVLLVQQLNDALASGAITKDSQAYYDLIDGINEISNGIDGDTESIVNLNNELRQLKWQVFDDGVESAKRLNDEISYYIDMMSDEVLFDKETGNFTDKGTATLRLRQEAYSANIETAQQYYRELLDVNQELAKDPNNQTLIDQQRKLQDGYWSSMQAANGEKEAIKSLIKEGYDAQLNALSKLITKYKDLKNNEKEAYEYQKNIAEKTENISSLQKQLTAYENNDTEEARAKVQQLQLNLKNAQEDLRDTQYDKYLSDSQNMLDDMYSKLEEFLNDKLDETNVILDEVKAILGGADGRTVVDTLEAIDIAQDGELSKTLQSILLGQGTSGGAVATAIGEQKKMFEGSISTAKSLEIDSTGKITGGYAKGSKYIKADEMAWTQENGGEMIYRRSDGAILTPLGMGDKVFTSAMSDNLWNWSKLTPEDLFTSGLLKNATNVATTNNNSMNNEFSLTFNISGVKDYDTFKSMLVGDKSFEREIQAMTLGQAMKGNSFAKYKY